MIKGWRYLFYAVIGLAVASIAWITINYILTDRLIKATGSEKIAERQAAAHKVMNRHKPIDFLAGQPETVRDNVVWSLESQLDQPAYTAANIEWLADVACELSGDLPSGDVDSDTGRLALRRVAADARQRAAVIKALSVRAAETTPKTLEREKYAHRRAVACRMLGVIGAKESTSQLVRGLRDEFDLVRQQAAAALARLQVTDEAGRKALDDYLNPLLKVLDGQYACYVRLDTEGRITNNVSRDTLLYGPFYVKVKSQGEASQADLDRQRDSAASIRADEEARTKETEKNLEQGRQGHVVRAVRAPTSLQIAGVTLVRFDKSAAGATANAANRLLADPAAQAAPLEVVEGETIAVQVQLANKGPGDVVSDFYVSFYAGSPRPRTNVDRPKTGEFKGERSRDLRGLIVPFDKRHVRSLYHVNLPDTPYDDTVDDVTLTVHFDTVERDRIEALRRLVNIGDASAIPVLGRALDDRSYTVRRQAAVGLLHLIDAPQTTPAQREGIATLLRIRGLTSTDPVVRCDAAEGLRHSRTAVAAQALLNLLVTEPDPTVRLVATRAIGGLPEQLRLAVLPALIKADPAVRMVVPRLLTGASQAKLAEELLATADPALARELLRNAGSLLSTASLAKVQRSADAGLRALATEELASRTQDVATQPLLLAALQDTEGSVRFAAARGLRVLVKDVAQPDPTVVAALVKLVKDEAGDFVGVKAGDKPADPLKAVITDKRARAQAVDGLVSVELPEAKLAVRDALQDTNADVLAAALPAVKLGRLGDQRDRLNAVMGDTKMPARVRQAAALAVWYSGMKIHPAAGEMPPVDPLAAAAKAAEAAAAKPADDAKKTDAKADAAKPEEKKPTEQEKVDKTLDALVGLLNDSNESVKTAAAVSLVGLGDDRGNKVLRDQIKSTSLEVRREAARLLATLSPEKIAKLGGLKDEERDPLGILFKDLYRDGSLPVNFKFLCRALKSLGGDAKTQQRLAAALKDPQPVLRAAAMTVMAELDSESGVTVSKSPGLQAVVAALDDPNELVRAYAAEAAGKLRLTDPAVVAKLRSMVGDQPDAAQPVVDAAGEALGELGVHI